MEGVISAICTAAFACALCMAGGCMDAGEETAMSIVVVPAEPTPAPAPDIAEDDEGWMVWREGSIGIGRLGEFQTYRPQKNGEYFHALRVEVDASGPLTLYFLTPDEMVNFKSRMMINSGDYSAVAAYEDVVSGTYSCVAEDDLTIALLNKENRPVTTVANIWYHE